MENKIVSILEQKLNALLEKQQTEGVSFNFTGKAGSIIRENTKLNIYLLFCEFLKFQHISRNQLFINNLNKHYLNSSLIFEEMQVIHVTILNQKNETMLSQNFDSKSIGKAVLIDTKPDENYKCIIKTSLIPKTLEIINLITKANFKLLENKKIASIQDYSDIFFKIEKNERFKVRNRLALLELKNIDSFPKEERIKKLTEKIDELTQKLNFNNIETLYFFFDNFNRLEMSNREFINKVKKYNKDLQN